jgi:hypothetical protein
VAAIFAALPQYERFWDEYVAWVAEYDAQKASWDGTVVEAAKHPWYDIHGTPDGCVIFHPPPYNKCGCNPLYYGGMTHLVVTLSPSLSTTVDDPLRMARFRTQPHHHTG